MCRVPQSLTISKALGWPHTLCISVLPGLGRPGGDRGVQMKLPKYQIREKECFFTAFFPHILLCLKWLIASSWKELLMKHLEGSVKLKASTSSWQNCSLLLVQRNSCLSNFFASPFAIFHAMPWRIWLHLQPPVGQPCHPQTEEAPPLDTRDLSSPLRDDSCCPGASAWQKKPGGLIPFSWGSEQKRWHPFVGRGIRVKGSYHSGQSIK